MVDGEPISGSLFDFGLYFFHNAKALIAKGSGHISTFLKCRAISRRACGTMYSYLRRNT